jgi:hypothetical protein
MRVSQAPPVAGATRTRPVMQLVPVMQTRLAKGVPWALGLEGTLVRLRVVPGAPAPVAVGTRPATAAETRPAIAAEIPPETVADTPRVIAEA